METEYGTLHLDYVSASNQRHSKSFQIKQRSTWADVRKFVIDEFSIAGNVFLTDSNGIDVTVNDMQTTPRGACRCILVQSEDRIGNTGAVLEQLLLINNKKLIFSRGEIFIPSAVNIHTDRYNDAEHSIYQRFL